MARKKALKIHVQENISVRAAPTITPTDEQGKVTGLSSENIKPIKLQGNGAIKEIEISVSASVIDDQQFLHRLLSEIRKMY